MLAPPVVPPATIGVLGGGQLGRYLVVAAQVMGYGTAVLDPDPGSPAGRLAGIHLVAAYDDPAALDELAGRCAVVTTEFENPPAAALERLARDVLVAPSAAAVAVAQDRIAEKRFLAGAGLPVAPWCPAGPAGPDGPVAFPAIVKTARLGYDGKGQVAVADREQLAVALSGLGVECVVEQRVPLDVELSVLVARTADGRLATYPVAENHHVGGILDLTVVPARVDEERATEARALAEHLASAMGYVGVLAVELFVSDGSLLVNEIAPRPHNSGHWTLDAAPTSQFDQQLRAVCGLALGPTGVVGGGAAAMVNLLGERWVTGEPDWAATLDDPDVRLHLYGKSEPRAGRKMGHLTVLGRSADEVAARAIERRSAVTR